MSEVTQIAQNLARNCSYAVFPCREDKSPGTPRGFKDAATDPKTIEQLWKRHPGPLVGVATGQRSNIDVLDVDVKHQGARAWLTAARSKLPPTRTFRTRSGGFHLLFRHAEGMRNSESKVAHGIDTRGEGGYVIFWYAAGYPCVDHSPVAAWPKWLLDAWHYEPPRPIAPQQDSPSPRWNRADQPWPQSVIDAMLDRVRNAAEGQRHHTLRASARTVGGLLHASNMTTTDAAGKLLAAVKHAGGAEVDDDNAAATIAWALDKGQAAPLQERLR